MLNQIRIHVQAVFLFILCVAPAAAFNLKPCSLYCNSQFDEYTCASAPGSEPYRTWQRHASEACEKTVCRADTYTGHSAGLDPRKCIADCQERDLARRRLVCDSCPDHRNPDACPGLAPRPTETTQRPVSSPERPESKPARPQQSPRRTPSVSCDNPQDCFRRGEQTARRAEEEARERRREYWRAMRRERESQASSLSAARQILSNWRQSMEQRGSRVTSMERAAYQGDQGLVGQAANPRARFTPEDALRAQDPGVMRELARHAEARELEEGLAKGDKEKEREEQEFRRLAERNAAREKSLDSAAQETSAPGEKNPEPRGSDPVVLGKLGSNAVNREALAAAAKGAGSERGADSPEAGLSVERPEFGEPAVSQAGAVRGAVAGGPAEKGSRTLRDLLSARLRERGGGGGGVSGSGLARGGEAASARQIREVSRAPSGSDSAASQGSSRAEAAQRFTLGEGTEGEVQALVHESGLGDGDAPGGLLGLESGNLFERVHQAHRSCLARDCVVGSARN